MIKKMKRQDADWDKKLQITYLTKDSHLEYIQNSQNSTIKKNTHSNFRKWAKDTKRQFTEEDIRMVKKHMKRSSYRPSEKYK